MKNPAIKHLILFIALSVAALGYSQAPQSTVDEFNIDADKVEKNFKTGETLFSGNVKMRHGAFLIEGESIAAFQNNNILEKAVAKGNPAVFQQLASEAEGLESVNASGNQIEFVDKAGEQSVTITNNALLRQGGITFTCNEITFILENGVVQQLDGSSGDAQCQASSNTQARAAAIINPDQATAIPE